MLRKSLNLAKLLVSDITKGVRVLTDNGIRHFIFRVFWYLRGERRTENIALNKVKKKSRKQNIRSLDTTQPIIFKKTSNPLVSIIIPVHNQWNYTYNCLTSVKANTHKDINYEVIVIDDNSSDYTKYMDEVIQNITVIRNDENLGFLKSCNKAAKHAKGTYLHFLNNDTYVHDNWLSSLLQLYKSDGKVGLVGSKLIYPNGTLQEAGGIIWSDASGMNYGKFDDADKPEYNYVKEVDYVSGASMLIKKDLWQKLAGFDTRFYPAYYEDTDLAFNVRASGFKVMYQPLSVITHFEGISNGTDKEPGIKKYQVDNQKKFFNKWENILKAENEIGKSVFKKRDRSSYRPHILIIDHKVPHYDQDAGSKSTTSYIKLFLKQGYHVTFFGDNFYRHEPYTTSLQQLGVEVFYGKYYRRNIKEWIKQNSSHFDIVITHRMQIAPKYLKLLRKYSNAKIAYIGHDLEFERARKQYVLTGDSKFKKESEKSCATEQKIFNQVDIILPFSTYEKAIIQNMAPDKIVKEIPVFFFKEIPETIPEFSTREDILFVGSFKHPPNLDGLLWFIENVFPKVLSKNSGCKLHIIGSNPPDEITRLASDSIKIAGFVSNAELEKYYQSCKLSVIPLRYGAGVKGKLIETMYYQLPSVITPTAAEGIPEIADHVLVTDDVEEFAGYIHLLYTNEKKWQEYSLKGKSLIQKYFSEKSAGDIISDLFEHPEFKKVVS